MANTLGNSLLILAGVIAIAAAASGNLRLMRGLLLAGGIAALAHFTVVAWSLTGFLVSAAFVLVAGVRFFSLMRHGGSKAILDHERELFEQVMQVEDPASQSRLRDVMRWTDIEVGEVLMQQGDRTPPLIYIARGCASISNNGKQVGLCGAGDFLGEMSVISGEQASATVTAIEVMRVARIDRAALGEMVRHVPELGRAIDGALNRSLAGKLLRMNRGSDSAGETE